jgi:hypothetical protein
VQLLLLVCVAILCSHFTAIAAQCPYSQAGLTAFSSVAEWNREGAAVTIPINANVLLDVSPPKLKSITVEGTLIFADKNIELKVDFIRVQAGKFIIGSETCPIKNKIIITFYGARTLESEIGTEPSDGGKLGSKGLAATSGSTIEVHGNVQGPVWTRLRLTANPGDRTIHLQEQVQWKKGDRIIVTSTDYGPLVKYSDDLKKNFKSIDWTLGKDDFPDQSEEHFVEAVSGLTIVLKDPLKYVHWGEGYERAEVALLTRNVVFKGDDDTVADEFGGHMLMRNVAIAKFSGIELYQMSQKGIVGRYPLHWHLLNPTDTIRPSDKRMYFRNSAVWRCYQRTVVVHDTNGVLIQNNVAYKNGGHMFFLEDGSERMNTFDNNIGISPVPIPVESGRQIVPTDNEPSVFWITNPNNTFINNVAVGGRFGFWFSMPVHPTGLSKARYAWPHPEVRPRNTPLAQFENNVAHGQGGNGLEIDNMELPDGTTEMATWNPKLPPYDTRLCLDGKDIVCTDPTACPKAYLCRTDAPPVVAHFKNFIAYKVRQVGVWTRASYIRMSNFTLLDNRRAIDNVPGPNILEDSLIVGETNNVGYVPSSYWQGRSRPDAWNWNSRITGFESYDNGGPQYLRNVTFKNFVSANGRIAGALAHLPGSQYIHETRNKYMQITYINSNKVAIETPKLDGPKSLTFLDIDGTTVGIQNGVAGGWIVSNETFLTALVPGCTPQPDWNGYICPFFPGGYAQLVVNAYVTSNKGDDAFDHPELFNKDNPITRASFYPLGRKERADRIGTFENGPWQYMTNLPVRNGYTIRWPYNIPTAQKINLRLESAMPGDWIVVAIPYPSSALPFNLKVTRWGSTVTTPNTRVYSLLDLALGNYYYDEQQEHVYVKLVNTANSYNTLFGYSDYSYDGIQVEVQASCSTCTVTPGKTAIPPAPVLSKDEKYQADLQPCQVPSNPSSSASGVGFFYFNPVTKELQFNLHHSLTDTVTSISFGVGAFGQQERLIQYTLSPYSPVSGAVVLSHAEWVALVRGRLFFRVNTERYPNGELRGQVLCKETQCTLPPQIENPDPCRTSLTDINLFTEGPMPKDFSTWTYDSDRDKQTRNTSYDMASTEHVLCGSTSAKLGLGQGSITLQFPWTKPPTIRLVDTNALEFFIRVAAGYDNLRLAIAFKNLDNKEFTKYILQVGDILNYKFDDSQWTRVLIPLSKIGIPDGIVIRSITFSQDVIDWNLRTYKAFYIDNIRFTKLYTSPLTPALPVSEQAKYKQLCKSTPLVEVSSFTDPTEAPKQQPTPVPKEISTKDLQAKLAAMTKDQLVKVIDDLVLHSNIDMTLAERTEIYNFIMTDRPATTDYCGTVCKANSVWMFGLVGSPQWCQCCTRNCGGLKASLCDLSGFTDKCKFLKV